MGPLLLSALTECPLARFRDLEIRGVTRRQVQYGLESGHVLAPIPGIYCLSTTEQEADPSEFEMALGCLASKGIVCGPSAAVYHGLNDDLPDHLHLIVPREYTDVPGQRPWTLWRSNVEGNLTIGVESREILGTEVLLTDPVRTVLDLYRFERVRQHALEALRHYLAGVGTVATLHAYARRLNKAGFFPVPQLFTDAEAILTAFERTPR